MKEYIERDAAIRTAIQAVVAYSLQITGNGITQFDVVDISERMKMIPVADVVERVRGEWIRYPHGSGIYCSRCHKKRRYKDADDSFCPNCGADMRGEKHDR